MRKRQIDFMPPVGWDTLTDPVFLPSGCSPALKDVSFRTVGVLRQRPAFRETASAVDWNATGHNVKMARFRTKDFDYLMMCIAGNLYYGTPSGLSSLTGTYAGKVVDCAQFARKFYFACDGGGPYYWDGAATGFTVVPNLPDGIWVLVAPWRERLFIACDIGINHREDTLWYSAPDDPTVWGASAFEKVPTGEVIKALVPFVGNLFVFTPNSIWVLAGTHPTNWVMRLVTKDFGHVGTPGSVTCDEMGIIFLDKTGIMCFDGSSFAYLGSRKGINPLEKEYRTVLEHGDKIEAVKVGKEYFLFFYHSSNVKLSKIWVYNFLTNAWGLWGDEATKRWAAPVVWDKDLYCLFANEASDVRYRISRMDVSQVRDRWKGVDYSFTSSFDTKLFGGEAIRLRYLDCDFAHATDVDLGCKVFDQLGQEVYSGSSGSFSGVGSRKVRFRVDKEVLLAKLRFLITSADFSLRRVSLSYSPKRGRYV